MAKEQYRVKIVEQWKSHATKPTVSGYLVYGWIGNPLLGKVRGTERVFRGDKAESHAQTYAKALRKMAKGG